MAGRLTEVAAKVGVSEATVSRVLNGRPGVSEATRDAVLTALDVLGYERPTKLRGERARLVGLVLPELQNPIFPAFADVVSSLLAKQGLTPVLCTQTVGGGVTEADYIELLFQQHVSGVLFAGGLYSGKEGEHGHYERLVERKLPTVMVNAGVEGLPFPRVSCDDAAAAELAVRHLLSLGHTRIGLVLGPHDHVPSLRRLDAAHAAMAAAGLELEEELIENAMHSLEGGQAATSRLIRRGATGVLCASDPMALGAVRAAKRAGLTVPADFSVVGYDDSAFMNCTEPPLTTVRQPIDAMGKAAVDILVGLVDGNTVEPDELLFAPELVVRNSTGPVPARRPRTT
ncbi:LacI family DNA-binding transcriptional regulator [Phytoactinopolyspora halotolerans]|uniref:Substrate-binding domain-containing protein n=1 Tax=Phytoactinopolyspora halotolerans TaxID=1981512 RepID=A0A6L9SJE0_9ACTN|nr:LacI family DNA-binding transcriptional regulator [Phytoactinopolyspora halotolerans]NEE04522.1 substrate-binding domain-containing protein [Phytoactinopolyspora halotolerans]